MTKSIPSVAADFSRQLATPIDVGDTTFTLNSLLDADGVTLVDAELYGFTIDSGAKKEYVVATLSSGTFTGVKSISRQGAVTTGFTIAHRVGAPAQITNHAALYRVLATLLGDIDLDSGTALKYDGAPAQTNPNALATVQFVLDTSAGVPVTFDATTVAGSVGENVTAGDWVYFKETDGLWYKTDADDTAKSVNVKLGKVRATTTTGNSVTGGIFVDGQETVATYVAGTTYYLSNTAGALATSAGTNSIIVGVGDDEGNLIFDVNGNYLPSKTEKEALAGGGELGTPSTSNKYLTEDSIASTVLFPTPIVIPFTNIFGSSTTQFDITNTAGTTYRYTFDGTGTDPNISATTVPVGRTLVLAAQNFNAANNGTFVVTGSGANYFEVTNASGVAEANKTIGSGSIKYGYAKPAGLKYIIAEVVGGGGAGGNGNNSGTADTPGEGGGGGGYARRLISAASLASAETVTIGAGGLAPNGNGGTTTLGSLLQATGGTGGEDAASGDTAGVAVGGVGTLGDINIGGEAGSKYGGAVNSAGGVGGSSVLGGGGGAEVAGRNYGGGGGGGGANSGAGANGAQGIVIVTEYYS